MGGITEAGRKSDPFKALMPCHKTWTKDPMDNGKPYKGFHFERALC